MNGGIAGDPVWHKVKRANITDDVKNEYLNHGDPDGDMYSVGEADVSIRSGWFYHDNQQPKSLKELMDIYFKVRWSWNPTPSQYSQPN